MNAQELRELETLVHHRVMGYAANTVVLPWATNRQFAMEVLEKCIVEKEVMLQIYQLGSRWFIVDCSLEINLNTSAIEVEAETLPLAICLFAKKLFSE